MKKKFRIYDLGIENDENFEPEIIEASTPEGALNIMLAEGDVEQIDGYKFRIECDGCEPVYLQSSLEIKIRRVEP